MEYPSSISCSSHSLSGPAAAYDRFPEHRNTLQIEDDLLLIIITHYDHKHGAVSDPNTLEDGTLAGHASSSTRRPKEPGILHEERHV